MNATIDGYTQIYIGMNSADIEFLKRTDVAYGTIWRTDGKEFPLVVRSGKWRTKGVGPFFEQKISYEIDISEAAIGRLGNGLPVSASIPTISFRTVYICVEGFS
jgi:hypothetical protein